MGELKEMVAINRRYAIAELLGATFLATVGPHPAEARINITSLSSAIPARRRSMPSGREFMNQKDILGANTPTDNQRDRKIAAQLIAGNIPNSLRDLQPVHVVAGQNTVTIYVMPDYLALGSNPDSVRTPMGFDTALQVADRLGFMLPTPKMVDAIYAQADVKLPPKPITASPAMESTNYLLAHDMTIDKQLRQIGKGARAFIAGHKKDIVLGNRLFRNPGKVDIYGWHRSVNSHIQPESTIHGYNYADYSHGARLVSKTAVVNGKPYDLYSLIASDAVGPHLNTSAADFRHIVRGYIGHNVTASAPLWPKSQALIPSP